MSILTNRFNLTASALAATALLAACGGGGSASAPAGAADTTAPTVAISDDISSTTATGNITFTFTFSEAVSGFTAADVTVSGGTKGAFTMASNNLSATLVVTPTANSTGTINVNVAANTFVDNATNANTDSASASQAYSTVVNPIVFASGYTALADPSTVGYAYQGTSTEGGSYNWTVENGATYGWGGSDFWWGGTTPLTDTPPNFYWGGAGKSDQAYMESWVNAPANGTVSLSGHTKLRITVWGNHELVGAPRFTPALQLADTNGCYPRAEAAPITPPTAGSVDATHNITLTSFSVVENCGTAMNISEFLTRPIASIKVRIYKANYHTGSGGTYGAPNGINMGPISFQP